MSSWLKAGLVGGAVLALISLLLTFFGQTVGLGCGITLLALLAFAGTGALAVYWMPPIREAGRSAGQGAMAAVIAQVIGGIAFTVLGVIQTSLVDTADVLSSIDPALLDQMVELGVDIQALETMLGPAGALLSGSFCCVGGLIFAAILGAVGGALFAAIKPED
jgi:hypothetical protein